MLTQDNPVAASTASALPRCRACNGLDLQVVLDLGQTPLANAFLTQAQTGQPEPRFPLVLAFCPKCSLVQITETIPPEVLFGHYLYFSSFSETMLDHAHGIVKRMVQSRRLGGKSLAVEIASNDGYLLQYYRQAGVPVLGIEPARNVARVAEKERAVPTLCQFFDSGLAAQLREQGQQADVIHANNVIAHVADLNGFVAGLAILLKDSGVAVIEAPYVKEMIDRVEFDTIYHEHLSYFSLTALDRLANSHGLFIEDVETINIHGGSLRIYVRRREQNSSSTAAVRALLAKESQCGLDTLRFYQDFAEKVEALKGSLLSLLHDLKSRGSHIAAYGASAKGSTLLNCAGIDQKLLDFVVDRSTAKQGLYTPGTHLPVYAPEKLLHARPDYALLLTWNFGAEIMEQQSEYRRLGGRFIIPIPEPQVA